MDYSTWIWMPPSPHRDAIETSVWEFGLVPLVIKDFADAVSQLERRHPKLLIFSIEESPSCQIVIWLLRDKPVKKVAVVDPAAGIDSLKWQSQGVDDFLFLTESIETAKHDLQKHITEIRANTSGQFEPLSTSTRIAARV